MTNTALSQYAGWSAVVSAIASILGFVTIVIFFMLGEPWGTINDVSSVVLALSILPVMLMLHRLLRRDAPTISLAVLVIGALAMLVAVVFQTLLIFRVLTFAQTAVVVPVAFGLFGAALMVFGYLALTHEAFPRRLALLSIIAGAGYVAVVAGFLLGGQEHPLAAIGGLISAICYPIWAIGFGRMLLAGKLIT